MAIVARCLGVYYDWGTKDDPGPGEVWSYGWLTKLGTISRKRRGAMEYASEADAWAHLRATGNIGYDPVRGKWSYVETE